jgi:hypothetical protein
MTTTVGGSTPYQLTVPELTETADIQVALKLLSYGISGDPANDAAITSNSLIGYLKTGLALKSNIASPTFTGTVTLPTGTSSVVPLKFASSNTLKSSPQIGAVEYDGSRLYITKSDSVRKTIAHTDEIGNIALHSGTVANSASPSTVTLVSGRDFSDYSKIQIVFSAIGISRAPTGRFLLRLNGISAGAYRMSYSNFAATTPTQASTLTETGYLIANSATVSSVATGSQILVDIINPGNNLTTKHLSWQNSNGFGFGTNNSITDPIGSISIATSGNTPDFAWAIYGIK